MLYSFDCLAMPNFARRYNSDCTMCHTNIPQLNRTGYEFRAAGYRLPTEIGKDEKEFNLGDFFTARIQEQWLNQHRQAAAGGRTSSDSLEFFEFTMYPLTGAWGRHFGSITELSLAPDDVFEIENAYVRGVFGNETGWFQARIGIMHPWEGFGASDRPLGNTRPMFQKSSAAGSPFYLWNLDESAIEAGYNLAKTGTFISARVSNGIVWAEDAPNHVDPAQGGSGGMATNKKTGYDERKNYQAFVTQFINDESAVSLYYYHGIITVPETDVTPPPAVTTQDEFSRMAAYVNFYVLPGKLNLLGGYERGRESLGNHALVPSAGTSSGYFGEVDFHAGLKFAAGLRYDEFKPTNEAIVSGTRESTQGTAILNYYATHGLQFIADYQMRTDQLAQGGRNKTNTLTARMIFIW